MTRPRIRVLALCVFRHAGRILVARLRDPLKEQDFYRPLGGGVKFGESAEEAIQREMEEELDARVKDFRLLGVLENRFTYDGTPGHEVIFIFDARFENKEVYSWGFVPAHEGADRQIETKWIDPYKKKRKTPLYPDGLRELLIKNQIKGV